MARITLADVTDLSALVSNMTLLFNSLPTSPGVVGLTSEALSGDRT